MDYMYRLYTYVIIYNITICHIYGIISRLSPQYPLLNCYVGTQIVVAHSAHTANLLEPQYYNEWAIRRDHVMASPLLNGYLIRYGIGTCCFLVHIDCAWMGHQWWINTHYCTTAVLDILWALCYFCYRHLMHSINELYQQHIIEGENK